MPAADTCWWCRDEIEEFRRQTFFGGGRKKRQAGRQADGRKKEKEKKVPKEIPTCCVVSRRPAGISFITSAATLGGIARTSAVSTNCREEKF